MKVIIEGFKVENDKLRFLAKGDISKSRRLVYYKKKDMAFDSPIFDDVEQLDIRLAGANLVCLKFIEES